MPADPASRRGDAGPRPAATAAADPRTAAAPPGPAAGQGADGTGAPARRPLLELDFEATSAEVRAALARITGAIAPLDPAPDRAIAVELAMAEVLNNVVEHAYAGQAPGPVQVTLTAEDRVLICRVEDEGIDLPDGLPPPGPLPDPEAARAIETLPEGGLGLPLIHALAERLTYLRLPGRNCLTCRLPLG